MQENVPEWPVRACPKADAHVVLQSKKQLSLVPIADVWDSSMKELQEQAHRLFGKDLTVYFRADAACGSPERNYFESKARIAALL